jgi:hypothetical protein
MNQTIAIPRQRPVGRERRRYHRLALVALLALMIGAIGLAIETPINLARAAFANETAVAEPLPTYPTRVIPEEWRGHREPVKYKHMYRTDPTPRLDWIR